MRMTDMQRQLADVVNRVAYRGERIVIHRRGKAVAALVSMADYDQLASASADVGRSRRHDSAGDRSKP